jgi:hypothetical protein
MKIAVSSFMKFASREIFHVRNSSPHPTNRFVPEQLWITRLLRRETAITAQRESARIEIEAVAGSAARRARLVWRFHPPTARGRYGEESQEGQDREKGQEGEKGEEVTLQRPGRSRSARAAVCRK